MPDLTFFSSATEIEIEIRFPGQLGGGDAWANFAIAFLDVALGGRGAWIATVADPSTLNWADIFGSNARGVQHLKCECNGRATEFGYVERFDGRVVREIVGSTDFQWDGVFVFPSDFDQLNDVISTLDNLDVRSEPRAGTREFVHSFGDGTGLRWVYPSSSSDMGHVKKAASENGFAVFPIAAADRI